MNIVFRGLSKQLLAVIPSERNIEIATTGVISADIAMKFRLEFDGGSKDLENITDAVTFEDIDVPELPVDIDMISLDSSRGIITVHGHHKASAYLN